MNKYWKSILVFTMIVLGIGTFYAQSIFASGGYPDFKIKTIAGDAKEAEAIQVRAHYSAPKYEGSVTITANGTSDMNDLTFWERLDGMINNPDYRRLTTDYRQFMRGKYMWGQNMYEDDDHLAYADIHYDFRSFQAGNFNFNIAVLDKENDETNEFTYDVKDDRAINHMYVESVEKVDDELKVFTTINRYSNGSDEHEIRLYIFDLNTQDLVDVKTVESVVDEGEYDAYLQMLRESDTLKPKDYVVFRRELIEHKVVEDEANGNYEEPHTVESDLIVYNLKTDELETLDMPKQLEEKARVNLFDGKNLYFTEANDTGLTIITYSIKDQNILHERHVDIDHAENVEEYAHLTVQNDRFYINYNQPESNQLPTIYILDTETGDIVYEGNIVAKTPADLPEDYSFSIFQLAVQ
ncbi:hypothetical protein [Lentibacillus saliphilus]|uniref:hypothetical protein n=1 Tax=Lentibacillus saliphilus TaxID=2737028 RepID=UPI001C2FFF02|nr:hypothetical protein [Lentibacillus saliphilus]